MLYHYKASNSEYTVVGVVFAETRQEAEKTIIADYNGKEHTRNMDIEWCARVTGSAATQTHLFLAQIKK